ncbi:MAG: beta-propeller fold lactonase family protein, partial [Alphaproteobacteria bacterium]
MRLFEESGRIARRAWTAPKRMAALLAVLSAVILASSAPAQEQEAYLIYVANEFNADITVIDPRTNEIVTSIPISGRPGDVRPRGMAVSPDGTIIYVAVSDFNPEFETPEDKIVGIDTRTNEVVIEFRAGGNPERLALSPDGTQIWASLEATARAAVYHADDGQQFASFIVGVESEGIAISPDGRWVYVTAEATHTVTVIDRENLTVLKHLLVGNRPR